MATLAERPPQNLSVLHDRTLPSTAAHAQQAGPRRQGEFSHSLTPVLFNELWVLLRFLSVHTTHPHILYIDKIFCTRNTVVDS